MIVAFRGDCVVPTALLFAVLALVLHLCFACWSSTSQSLMVSCAAVFVAGQGLRSFEAMPLSFNILLCLRRDDLCVRCVQSAMLFEFAPRISCPVLTMLPHAEALPRGFSSGKSDQVSSSYHKTIACFACFSQRCIRAVFACVAVSLPLYRTGIAFLKHRRQCRC